MTYMGLFWTWRSSQVGMDFSLKFGRPWTSLFLFVFRMYVLILYSIRCHSFRFNSQFWFSAVNTNFFFLLGYMSFQIRKPLNFMAWRFFSVSLRININTHFYIRKMFPLCQGLDLTLVVTELRSVHYVFKCQLLSFSLIIKEHLYCSDI